MADDALSPDDVFELLSDDCRRHALSILAAHGESLTLADLADEVAVRLHDAPLGELSAETVAEVYMSLYHHHVPKLAAEDVVAYDQERDLVSPDDNLDHCREYLPSLGPGGEA
jgi:hypothetical protein